MGLEQILDAQKPFKKGQELSRGWAEKSSSPDYWPQFIKTIYNPTTIPRQDYFLSRQEAEHSTNLINYIRDTEKGLYDAVSADYETAIAAVPKGALVNLALSIPAQKTGKGNHDKLAKLHAKISKIQDELSQEKFDFYLADVANDSKYAAESFARLAETNPQQLAELIKADLKFYANQFLSQFADKKSESIDSEKLRNYIDTNVKSIKNEDLKKRVYINIGNLASKK